MNDNTIIYTTMSRKILFVFTLLLALALSAACNGQADNKVQTTDKTGGNMNTIEMNKAMFLEKVTNYEANPNEFNYLGDKPAIIDFYATWCGPCKMMSPRLDSIAEKFDGKLVVYKIDIDKERELAGLFGIQSIPSLLFIPMEGQPQMSVGLLSGADLEKAVATVLKVE